MRGCGTAVSVSVTQAHAYGMSIGVGVNDGIGRGTDVAWDGCRAGQIASAPRTEDCVGCKRCESACPTDFLSVRVYLGGETTRSLGLAY